MSAKNDESDEEKELQCKDCGRILGFEGRGLRWEKCQICGDIICLDCTYYNRVKREGLFDYYYDVVRVCKKHRI
ncbi:MAG: hypothetical protein L6M37_01320 [Candidatus Methylarchaceae archaeon HK02M1]|nr:hypothetical protein [Candidatus Methylarchaceae archaeon HK01M]MCP8311577.1 hypothetical protein [Candidatus Methylarchaceae archaeon HK02M1]